MELMNSEKNTVRPINNNKNKLNNKIILIFHFNAFKIKSQL